MPAEAVFSGEWGDSWIWDGGERYLKLYVAVLSEKSSLVFSHRHGIVVSSVRRKGD